MDAKPKNIFHSLTGTARPCKLGFDDNSQHVMLCFTACHAVKLFLLSCSGFLPSTHFCAMPGWNNTCV